MIDAVLEFAALTGHETVLETPAGSGLLTAFLAETAGNLVAIEQNPDAVADLVVNLHDLDNVALYEGSEEDILPNLEAAVDVIVAHPASGGI
jgi:23S rRNA (uracil1939-C5)-methyltransferase